MLPKEVLLRIQEELIEYENSKASVMEISHRGVDFMEAAKKSEEDLRLLLKIPDNYKVLFLQGGASAQFSMVPINLLRGGTKANYANTGHWSVKAIAEAKRYCNVHICSDSSANNFTDIEDFHDWKVDEDAAYFHYTPNETIAGLEFDTFLMYQCRLLQICLQQSYLERLMFQNMVSFMRVHKKILVHLALQS